MNTENGADGYNGHNGIETGANGNGNGNSSVHSPTRAVSPKSATDTDQRVSSSNSADNEIEAMFERLQIERGSTRLQPKIPRGAALNIDTPIGVFTNVHSLNVGNAPIYQYHIEFTRIYTSRDGLEVKSPFGVSGRDSLDPGSKNLLKKMPDYMVQRVRQQMRHLFNACIGQFPQYFNGDPNKFCFDYANTVFSLHQLEKMTDSLALPQDVSFEVIRQPCTLTFKVIEPQNNVFSALDFKKAFTEDLAAKDTNIVRFLELATSHYAAEHPQEHLTYDAKNTYFLNPAQYGFGANSCPSLGCGKYLNVGASKTVISTEKTGDFPALVIDSKKTAFYAVAPIIDLCCAICNVQPNAVISEQQLIVLRRFFKNRVVQPIHLGEKHAFPIHDLTDDDARSKFFEHAGQQISVADYYRQKYNKALQYPQWPLAARFFKRDKAYHYYPLEVLMMADNQRVNHQNLTPDDIAVIVKACAVPPLVKADECYKCEASFAINSDPLCDNANVKVDDNPIKLQGRILAAPTISYANGSLNPEGNGKWRLPRGATYVKCSELKNWAAILINYRGDRFSLAEFQQFIDRYGKESYNRGMFTDAPMGIWECASTETDIEYYFKSARENGCKFLVFGHPDNEKNLHGLIKAMERKYGVISQCIKTRTMGNVLKKSPLSLENIVAKTNVKLGGLNYNCIVKPSNISPKVLFIGLGSNQPAGGFLGSAKENGLGIYGFSANDGENPNEFIGNFFLQPAFRDNAIYIFEEIIDEIMERFLANRSYTPEHIVFYRNGCSEGQYTSVLRREVPVLKALFAKHAPKASLTVIIPSKMHAVRFFRNELAQMNAGTRSDDQNVRPGSCFDADIVNPVYSEFYLNSHLALQGTAKTPKYTILYTDYPGATMDIFQRWTNALCHNFQIVTSPISLPAPVYIANRYAERGRQIVNANVSSDNTLETVQNATKKGPFYEESVRFNFTRRPDLRARRVNA